MIVGKTGGVTGPQPIDPNRAAEAKKAYKPETAQKADSAEISVHARMLQKLHEMPPMRQERIDEIRQQIDGGTYESEEKIRAAVEKLFEELGE